MTMPYDYDPDDSEREELRAQVRYEAQMRRRYLAHPDPRDPDYPGDPEDFPSTDDDQE